VGIPGNQFRSSTVPINVKRPGTAMSDRDCKACKHALNKLTTLALRIDTHASNASELFTFSSPGRHSDATGATAV
jgi:hypothetical protein